MALPNLVAHFINFPDSLKASCCSAKLLPIFYHIFPIQFAPFNPHPPQAPSRRPRAPLLSYACCLPRCPLVVVRLLSRPPCCRTLVVPIPRLTPAPSRSPVLGRVNSVHPRALVLTASLPRGAAHQVSFSVFCKTAKMRLAHQPPRFFGPRHISSSMILPTFSLDSFSTTRPERDDGSGTHRSSPSVPTISNRPRSMLK